MIEIYFIKNIIFKLLIDSFHRLKSPIIEQKSLERASDEKKQMILEVEEVLEIIWPNSLILQFKKLKLKEVK